jgi:hypothetical protein
MLTMADEDADALVEEDVLIFFGTLLFSGATFSISSPVRFCPAEVTAACRAGCC